ncbi:transposase, mutator type [Rickettsia akari str. Hartford]|uniref:Transposase, mutator type n=1 Tax=Rickettsia akari (strain Hartford) TaxID=293614 RepID=A8GP08_RICAH|nr:transposase, mutator type [Rickettsia akari str. Hartford]
MRSILKLRQSQNNRRNGHYEKNILDEEDRKLRLEVPRDRDGEYEPILIPRGVRKFEGFDAKADIIICTRYDY